MTQHTVPTETPARPAQPARFDSSMSRLFRLTVVLLTTLIVPITTTLRPFLEKNGHPVEDVERMHQAWIKSVILQVTLWCHPYVRDGDF